MCSVCSVLQRGAACCSVLKRGAACCSVLHILVIDSSKMQEVDFVLQCVAVCCGELQCVACNSC